MKIIFVGPFGLQPKGTMSVRALPLAKALVNKGHSVTMLLPPWDDIERSNKTWTDENVEIVNVKLPIRIPLYFELLLVFRLVQYILFNKPDIIHFFKPKAYSGLVHLTLYCLRQLKLFSIPLVVDSDDWEQAWNQVLPYSWLQKKVFSWQENWGLKAAEAITVASRTLESLSKDLRNGDSSKIFYLPNGCRKIPIYSSPELSKVSELRSFWNLGDAPVILLYSRFLEFRLERIVKQISLIAEKLPQARWLIVGQGLYNEDKILSELINQCELSDYVRFTGWVPTNQLEEYFSVSDVAIYPYDDNLINRTKCSVKLIDLLVSGVPVVADAIGQNCEYIKEGVTGYLVEPENDIAMANRVIELIQSYKIKKIISLQSYNTIIKDYNWYNLSTIVEKLYCKTLKV